MKKLLFSLFIFTKIISLETDQSIIKTSEFEFVLVVEKNSKTYLARFPLDNVRKSRFPSGPLRNNLANKHDFSEVNQEEVKSICDKGLKLSFFCLNNINCRCSENCNCDKEQTSKKCAFEIPGEQPLEYVFSIDNDVTDISGYILKMRTSSDYSKILCNDKQPELQMLVTRKINFEIPFKEKLSNYFLLIKALSLIKIMSLKDYIYAFKFVQNMQNLFTRSHNNVLADEGSEINLDDPEIELAAQTKIEENLSLAQKLKNWGRFILGSCKFITLLIRKRLNL